MSDAAPEIAPGEDVREDAAVAVDEPSKKAPDRQDWPMAWHCFLSGFLLWAEAALHVAQAGGLLWGKQYYNPEIRELVYAGLPGLRMLDLGLALVAALGALLCVRAAIALRRRDCAGPRLLRAAYLLLLTGQIAFAAGRYFIAGLTPVSASALGQMIVYLALLLVNGNYYRKRRDDFVRRG